MIEQSKSKEAYYHFSILVNDKVSEIAGRYLNLRRYHGVNKLTGKSFDYFLTTRTKTTLGDNLRVKPASIQ